MTDYPSKDAGVPTPCEGKAWFLSTVGIESKSRRIAIQYTNHYTTIQYGHSIHQYGINFMGFNALYIILLKERNISKFFESLNTHARINAGSGA